ncbi:hypothetical protein B0T10DRAFT_181220 [Thelonectria olida]|uniref:Uncharacterized protein n=1 Tax=Thelonectria olida TaxID=1576542 RepID=A0A9P8WGW0_9HYPO|nr:hypothetical protein B0T10DRAFT_181220 [Thelonectria olida]
MLWSHQSSPVFFTLSKLPFIAKGGRAPSALGGLLISLGRRMRHQPASFLLPSRLGSLVCGFWMILCLSNTASHSFVFCCCLPLFSITLQPSYFILCALSRPQTTTCQCTKPSAPGALPHGAGSPGRWDTAESRGSSPGKRNETIASSSTMFNAESTARLVRELFDFPFTSFLKIFLSPLEHGFGAFRLLCSMPSWSTGVATISWSQPTA